ncbi:hypothetical protein ACTWPB_14230 [Nocardia sp. IBHARD005]|uniref:hypothetical protein n=1 Tax=Nocardia sp. IBHARD005 TaxID=3457765 RepID=UPI00405A3AD1
MNSIETVDVHAALIRCGSGAAVISIRRPSRLDIPSMRVGTTSSLGIRRIDGVIRSARRTTNRRSESATGTRRFVEVDFVALALRNWKAESITPVVMMPGRYGGIHHFC